MEVKRAEAKHWSADRDASAKKTFADAATARAPFASPQIRDEWQVTRDGREPVARHLPPAIAALRRGEPAAIFAGRRTPAPEHG